MTQPVFAIDGVPRHYAWGSPTAIPQLLGIEAEGQPVAELWFGAHPGDPSPVHGHKSLDELISASPMTMLGSGVVNRFGPTLPFLLKILAADHALSMQVHPTLEQARAGFAAEEAQGLPRDNPRRNYRDANHKPELLCALTPFTALCGFRPPAQTIALIDTLGLGDLLADVRADLTEGDEPAAVRAAFTRLLTVTPARMADLVDAVVAICRPKAATNNAARILELCASDFPGDIGVVLTLLLNDVELQPGEAIFVGAGNVHAYVRGVGVEIMANSDNVLRCGLTPKPIDVPELLRIADFTPLRDPRCPSRGTDPVSFDVPVDDFALFRLEVDGPATVGVPGPHIVLAGSGTVRVTANLSSVELDAGRAAFVTDQAGAFTVDGAGEVFIAGVGAPGVGSAKT